MTDPHLRPARPADGTALGRLQSHLSRRSPDLLDYGVVVGDVLVTTADDGTVVGYVLPVYGEGVHVAELVVDPAHQREGRATALLDSVCDSCASGERVTLAVTPDNEGAQAFYRDYGFDVGERRPKYFDGDPALWLVKDV